MIKTPEGRIKTLTKELFSKYKIRNAKDAGRYTSEDVKGYFFMPIQSMYAVKGVPDFIGCYRGRFFSVETKSPGKSPTKLQAMQMEMISWARGKAFVVDGEESLNELERWLSESG